MKNIISLTIQTDEEKVLVHLEMDKEKFKTTILPLLTHVTQFASGSKKATE